MSSVLNLTEAKAKFSDVVDRVSHGEEIIVTRMGHPVARITRYEPAAANRRLGFFEGRIRLAEDFESYADDVALEFADWFPIDEGRPVKLDELEI